MPMSHKKALDQAPKSAPSQVGTSHQSALQMSALDKFGANLRGAREALGWAGQQLAARIGISEDHLAKIEAGISQQVDIDLIAAIKKHLGISYADLLEGVR